MRLLRHREIKSEDYIWLTMNTIVFNELSGQVLFEEKANEVEMSSRNYLDVIDGQHPDLLSNKQTIRESQAMRHRRSGYVQPSLCILLVYSNTQPLFLIRFVKQIVLICAMHSFTHINLTEKSKTFLEFILDKTADV